MRTLQAEVVVIGGGTAGVLAAVTAKRAGRSVVLVRRGDSATMQSSGAVDVAEDHDACPLGRNRSVFDAGVPYLEAARRLAGRLPAHPYAVVDGCVEAIPAALMLLREVASSAALKGSDVDGKNLALTTVLGTVKRTALAQASMVGGDWVSGARDARVGVVHLPQLQQGDGANIIAVLDEVARLGPPDGFRPSTVLLELDGVLTGSDALRSPRDIAARLEREEHADALIEALVTSVKRVGGVDRILVPPVLGLRNAPRLHERVQRALQVPVAEVLSLPPSVPGERLQRALDEGLAREGVQVLDGEVRTAGKDVGRVSHVEVSLHAGEAVRVTLGALVLATGKYLSGGIRREERFLEPVLDLPMFLDGKPVEPGWVGQFVSEAPEAQQAFLRVGVHTDARLRPLAHAPRKALYENVYAAGAVLDGYDAARQRSGLGVAAVTGMLAGRFAAQVA